MIFLIDKLSIDYLMILHVTPETADRIAHLLTKDKKMIALRVAVDGGGCSGFMYQYRLIDEISKDDFVITIKNIKIAIDPLSRKFLDGCTFEFIEELGSSYFQVKNPNATAKCGCGNSFSL